MLFPDDFKVSKSLNKLIRDNYFSIKMDEDFDSVISNCAKILRPDQSETWITNEMRQAYNELHQLGIAHSFETYYNGELVGGLYGISLGKAFFGESMFHKKSDASKVALFFLVEWCKMNEFHFIDAQQPTDHLKSLGAIEMNRTKFLKLLNTALQFETIKGNWSMDFS